MTVLFVLLLLFGVPAACIVLAFCGAFPQQAGASPPSSTLRELKLQTKTLDLILKELKAQTGVLRKTSSTVEEILKDTNR